MHDLDRTQLETIWEAEGEFDGYESEGDFEPEFDGYESEGDFEPEFGGYESEGDFEPEFGGYESEGEFESPLSEDLEMEMAAQLLGLTDEAELDMFLGSLISTAARGAGRFMRSSTGRALGSALKDVAQSVLPVVGSAIGGAIMPGAGTAIGGALGNVASQALGMELEGLSPEDQEFEVARRVIRLAADAAKVAATAPPNVPPAVVARKAVAVALRQHAPGLSSEFGRRYRRPLYGRPRSPWYRRSAPYRRPLYGRYRSPWYRRSASYRRPLYGRYRSPSRFRPTPSRRYGMRRR